MSRPLAALASVVLAVLGVVFLFPPDCASACSCMMPGGVQDPERRALAMSSAVFSGEVVDFDKSPPHATATVRVSNVWKGPKQQTVEITTSSDEAACGFPFKEGQEYLVYAYTGKQGLEVDLCGATNPLSEADANLKALGEGEKPQDGGEGEVLSDTSGGFSVRAMVGGAGLALAASFLVVMRLVRSG